MIIDPATLERDAQLVRSVMASMSDGLLHLPPWEDLDESGRDRWRNYVLWTLSRLPHLAPKPVTDESPCPHPENLQRSHLVTVCQCGAVYSEDGWAT